MATDVLTYLCINQIFFDVHQSINTAFCEGIHENMNRWIDTCRQMTGGCIDRQIDDWMNRQMVRQINTCTGTYMCMDRQMTG